MSRDLLWVDSRAGLAVGVGVLLFSEWLAAFFGLPRGVLLVMGGANLVYGTYSGVLRTRRPRPMVALVALIIANAAWAVGCLVAAVVFAPTATVFGVGHLAGEGVIVGALAWMEWRARKVLAAA